MKLFNDYTGKEVESLTDEDIQRLINLECADRGAPMLPPLPVEPKAPEVKPDMTLYQVAYGLYVDNLPDATKIIEAIKSSSAIYDTNYCCGYQYQRATPKSLADTAMTTSQVFSPEKWGSAENDYAKYEAAKKQYDADIKEYQSAAGERSAVSEYIWGIVSECRRFMNRREQMLGYLQQYIDLAEGDAETGARFFKKAYSDWNKYLSEDLTPIDYAHDDLAQ